MRAAPRSFVGIPLVCVVVVWLLLLFALSPAAAQDFRITSVQVTNNDVRINWEAPGGSNYVVQVSTQLSATNFIDLSPLVPVGGIGLQSTGYTHVGGVLASTSRYYRVRSFPFTPQLQIQPTNAIIGVGMTNRYKVYALTPGSTNDVTAAASLTALNASAQAVRFTNGYWLVRGASAGNGTLRAVYQGITNMASITVAPLTGMYTVPPLSQINGFVEGTSTSVKVMGVFGAQTNNITPASNLESVFGGSPVGTRVDYNLRADVANSFALITGQSAAAEDLVFTAGGQSAEDFHVNWCWFTGLSLYPGNAQITVGQTEQFEVWGTLANGGSVDALAVPGVFLNNFEVDPPYFAQVNSSTLNVTGLSPGEGTINVNVDNGPGSFCAGGISASIPISVVCPGYYHVDQSFIASGGNISGVEAVGIQSDGMIIINSGFNFARLSRLDSSGNADGSFNPGTGPDGEVRAIASLPDGRILIAGDFTSYNGTNRNRIARLNSDGSLDLSFDSGAGANGEISAIAVQPDGRILIAGNFSSYNGTNRSRIARLEDDGSLDATFNPGTGVSGHVNTLVLRPDGKVVIAGFFGSVNGTNRSSIARLNANGSLDLNFNPGSGPNNEIHSIAEQVDGKIIAGGAFTTFNGVARSGLARLNTNGSLDSGFNPSLAVGNNFNQRIVQSLVVQPDGRIIVGGLFNQVSGVLTHQNLARFESNGSLDADFAACGAGNAFSSVSVVAQDRCRGHAYVGGDFILFNGVDRRYLARVLTGAPVTSTNDHFNNRLPLAGSQLSTTAANSCATKQSGEPNHVANEGGKSVWWSWTAPTNGYVIISTCGSDFDTLLAVYTGASVSTLSLVASNDEAVCSGDLTSQSQVEFQAVAGTEYQIAVDGFKYFDELEARSGQITLDLHYPLAAPNDHFTNRTALTGINPTATANNIAASKEPGEPDHAEDNGGKSLWWSWTAPANGLVTINTCGSEFDTLLAVYTGNAVNALTLVAENDDAAVCAGDGLQSRVQFPAIGGVTYQIAVDGFNYSDEPVARSGDVVLSIVQ